jgi:hypothetical protein
MKQVSLVYMSLRLASHFFSSIHACSLAQTTKAIHTCILVFCKLRAHLEVVVGVDVIDEIVPFVAHKGVVDNHRCM